jgi:hypothetical protein
MNLQDFQGLSPEGIKNLAAMMMLQSYVPIFTTCVVMLISYIMRSYALSKITAKLHFENTNIAWIPFGHGYVEGYICDYLKSNRLDKSNMRIHYLMLNIIHCTVTFGYMIYQAVWTTNILMPVFETGEITTTALQPGSDNNTMLLYVANIILTVIISYFKVKSLFFLYYCFNKRDGMLWIGLSLVVNFINPVLMLILSQREPVNTSIGASPFNKNQE